MISNSLSCSWCSLTSNSSTNPCSSIDSFAASSALWLILFGFQGLGCKAFTGTSIDLPLTRYGIYPPQILSPAFPTAWLHLLPFSVKPQALYEVYVWLLPWLQHPPCTSVVPLSPLSNPHRRNERVGSRSRSHWSRRGNGLVSRVGLHREDEPYIGYRFSGSSSSLR